VFQIYRHENTGLRARHLTGNKKWACAHWCVSPNAGNYTTVLPVIYAAWEQKTNGGEGAATARNRTPEQFRAPDFGRLLNTCFARFPMPSAAKAANQNEAVNAALEALRHPKLLQLSSLSAAGQGTVKGTVKGALVVPA
jgi:hypothetical protein